MTDIQHGKITTIDSYYEGKVVSQKQEVEQSILTDKDVLLKDIITALSLFNSGNTDKLTLEVCRDIKGRWRLVKKWQV